MENTIWKYELSIEQQVVLAVPTGAKVLDVQMQRNVPCLWMLVDASIKERDVRKFRIYGTGHRMPKDPGTYIGTFQYDIFVWHVFEEK